MASCRTVSISYDNDHYTTDTSLILLHIFFVYVLSNIFLCYFLCLFFLLSFFLSYLLFPSFSFLPSIVLKTEFSFSMASCRTVFISYDNDHYTTGTSLILFHNFFVYVLSSIFSSFFLCLFFLCSIILVFHFFLRLLTYFISFSFLSFPSFLFCFFLSLFISTFIQYFHPSSFFHCSILRFIVPSYFFRPLYILSFLLLTFFWCLHNSNILATYYYYIDKTKSTNNRKEL